MFFLFQRNYDTDIRVTFSTQFVVFRDSTGSIINCTSIISSHCYALYSETTTVILATRLAASLRVSSFILESDSLNVTMTLQQSAITTY
jgi:hypothetical protein